MLTTKFKLISKVSLTHDVYELIYSCDDLKTENFVAGQYVLFQLSPGLNRAYSVAFFTEDTFTLIIKRIPHGQGSPKICDAAIGTVFHGILPLGHFLLKDTPMSKCFIGTGTGFAPLYCQMNFFGQKDFPEKKVSFIFGVRSFSDSFYEQEVLSLQKKFSSAQFIEYFSREEEFSSRPSTHKSKKGYVTDWITEENISDYGEFYICGSPVMVKSAKEKLEVLGVQKEQIFSEQF